MPISSVTSASTVAANKSADATASGLAATSDTFLKLLVTNLQHQDPTSPQDSNQYVQQISQMTMVEQMTKLANTSNSAAKDQSMASVIALLGHDVTYTDADGNAVTGKVGKVDVSGDAPTITVGETAGIDPRSVTTVG